MEKSKRVKGDLDEGMHIDKTQVLQEARQCFMATSVKPKKLINVLTKCIFVLLQGEKLAPAEATDLFFHITRLFQYKDKDNRLQRLTYIAIKALSQQAENIHIVTSSLITDVNSTRYDPSVRASALRALCQIMNASTFTSIEQYLKQSIVDKCPVIASAAISSLIHIAQTNTEVVERCIVEIQQALNSESSMVQYHALGLYYNYCQNDPLKVAQLIDKCMKLNLKSPLASCLAIRITSNYALNSNKEDKKYYSTHIKEFLRHESEMVRFEASSGLVKTKCDNYMEGVASLRSFLTSQNAPLRFASLRSLNELSDTLPIDVRYWSIHRIGQVCKLRLWNKRHRLGEHIVGILDFSNSNVSCAKYTVILQCEETQQIEFKHEFSLGLKMTDFQIAIPPVITKLSVLHCVLSFLFYIADKNHPKTLFEDKAGTIELGPSELETKQFSCDFPIAIYT